MTQISQNVVIDGQA